MDGVIVLLDVLHGRDFHVIHTHHESFNVPTACSLAPRLLLELKLLTKHVAWLRGRRRRVRALRRQQREHLKVLIGAPTTASATSLLLFFLYGV